ncbi:hypothetical protein DMN91_002878 [Ooceraea biroi]|uniref:Uncharacterized protein n=1 Tax=Ooceraea biroi TaxID=2015173 RepID=A0A3L8DY98_OOCBI|nr:hypothetical protein DMN91_002878 [Ooceraea biroi]
MRGTKRNGRRKERERKKGREERRRWVRQIREGGCRGRVKWQAKGGGGGGLILFIYLPDLREFPYILPIIIEQGQFHTGESMSPGMMQRNEEGREKRDK